jgi:hypothetical protein
VPRKMEARAQSTVAAAMTLCLSGEKKRAKGVVGVKRQRNWRAVGGGNAGAQRRGEQGAWPGTAARVRRARHCVEQCGDSDRGGRVR